SKRLHSFPFEELQHIVHHRDHFTEMHFLINESTVGKSEVRMQHIINPMCRKDRHPISFFFYYERKIRKSVGMIIHKPSVEQKSSVAGTGNELVPLCRVVWGISPDLVGHSQKYARKLS